ncbi:MAG: hypothetical protein DMD80_01030 [Candidatus Rokuibacteriota bacterium]|nr:MAG: hypothetical protein DMD80_01030 [Candidatus Rokubacteria bacterium]
MARAPLVLREKFTDGRGDIVDLAIWKVATAPKGHHRHVEGFEQPYAFSDVTRLIADFMADVKQTTERRDA